MMPMPVGAQAALLNPGNSKAFLARQPAELRASGNDLLYLRDERFMLHYYLQET
jgi:hypothetical protein